jgi:hypothetical protein
MPAAAAENIVEKTASEPDIMIFSWHSGTVRDIFTPWI